MEPIDLKAAREMVARYKSTRKAIIDKHHGVNDTESTWISIETLKKFIEKLPPEATGVRLHFGVHDEHHDLTPHQTSIAIAATIADGNGNHIDAIQSDKVNAALGSGLEVNNRSKDCPPACA